MNEKSRRKQLILDVVAENRIESQEQILHQLRKRGVEATQATISRDLRELALYKGPTGYSATPPADSAAGTVVPGSHLGESLRMFMLTAHDAGSLIVMRTRPGHASPLASAVDRGNLVGVVGTIAGDDTVFVAASSASRAKALVRAARAMVARP